MFVFTSPNQYETEIHEIFSKIVLSKISQITVLLTQYKFRCSQIESSRTELSVMRLLILLLNQHNPLLYRDHVNRLDCLRMAKILIYYIQLHLRNTDF